VSVGSEQGIVTKACRDHRNEPVDYITIPVFSRAI